MFPEPEINEDKEGIRNTTLHFERNIEEYNYSPGNLFMWFFDEK